MENSLRQNTLQIYGASWSEPEHSKRLQIYAKCLDPSFVYTDPTTQIGGYEQFSNYMAELQANIAGVSFVPTDLQSHHGRSLMHWNMVDGTGAVLSPGASFFMFAADGRLQHMTGFFAVPASE